MPRESLVKKAGRLTRSGLRDPLWETVVTLQERASFLERQVRRGERTKESLQEEIRRLEVDVERLASQGTSTIRERALEQENQNLRRRIAQLIQAMRLLGVPVPVPLERAFSSFNIN